MFSLSVVKQALIILILLASPSVSALVLGELAIIKAEGRLTGEIEVRELEDVNQEKIIVSIAQPSLYRQLGLFYSHFLNELQLGYRVINGKQGLVIISLPYGATDVFDLLIEIRWPQGRLVRRYIVRLQNNLFATEDKVIVRISPAEIPAIRETGEELESKEVEIAERMRNVRVDTVEGDNWRNIAEAIRQAYLREESINVEQIMLALRDANVEDFSGSQSSILRIGASLHLPDYYEITLRSSAEARQIIAAIFKARSAKPLLVLSAPQTQTSGGSAVLEELDKTQREEEDIQGQLALVDAQLEQVEKLITLKGEELAILQTAAAEQENQKALSLLQNGSITNEHLNTLNFAIRQRASEFFDEVRDQPFFWAVVALIIFFLISLYLYIFAKTKRKKTNKATLMRELRRSSARDTDQQSHLFPTGSDDAHTVRDASVLDSQIPSTKYDLKDGSTATPQQKKSEPAPQTAPTLQDAPTPQTETVRQKEGILLQDNARRASLDLARAYINMGENKKAEKLLREVVEQGSVKEREQAEKLLDQIPQ